MRASRIAATLQHKSFAPLWQVRNVDVLWLLALSAPEKTYAEVAPMLERVSASFSVPPDPAAQPGS